MSGSNTTKIVARNVAAIRRFGEQSRITEIIAGNPAATRLESGVGNCFPGLECDLRNLERRFFPFMQVEAIGNILLVADINIDDVDRARASEAITLADAVVYQALAEDIAAARLVLIARIAGTFGLLGRQEFDLELIEIDGQPAVEGDLNGSSEGPDRRPSDAWTAVRLLTEGSDVTLTFRRQGAAEQLKLTAPRARYLDDNGALSAAFLPGELTQSLCSPWTHDFRDCGCFYWASNHPDIAQPILPSSGASDQSWDRDVPWQRRNRIIGIEPPPPATAASAAPIELRHYEINNRWQELHFVVGRREVTAPYLPRGPEQAESFPSLTVLLEHLRYAAGVELAVAQEYLSAAYSLKLPSDPSIDGNAELRDTIRATRSELMRIAIGEMRHTRAVNDVIRGLMAPGTFQPALRVASRVPGAAGKFRDVVMRAATRTTISDFIDIEAPSAGVDGLYGRILATLVNPPADVAPVVTDEWCESIRSIIAEGEDHFETFLDIQEWLADHKESDYLRSVSPSHPPADDAANQQLQAAYKDMLTNLRDGYRKGRFLGATEVNTARSRIVEPNGLNILADAVAEKGFLVVFEAPGGAEFVPLEPPSLT